MLINLLKLLFLLLVASLAAAAVELFIAGIVWFVDWQVTTPTPDTWQQIRIGVVLTFLCVLGAGAHLWDELPPQGKRHD